MAYSLVISDLGGVVVDVDADRLVHQAAQLAGRSFDDVQAAVYHRELLLPLELGQITPEAYFQGLQERLRLTWTYEQFVRAWNDIFTEKRDVVALFRALTARHAVIALSNTNVLHLSHIRGQMPSLGFFTEWIASCHVGLRKPDPRMYRLALERAGVAPEAAVFVDDRPEMVEGARRVGLTAIRFEGAPQLAAALRALGIACD